MMLIHRSILGKLMNPPWSSVKFQTLHQSILSEHWLDRHAAPQMTSLYSL